MSDKRVPAVVERGVFAPKTDLEKVEELEPADDQLRFDYFFDSGGNLIGYRLSGSQPKGALADKPPPLRICDLKG